MNKISAVVASISILGLAFLFWYFIGGSLTTRVVNETIPFATTSTNLPTTAPTSTNPPATKPPPTNPPIIIPQSTIPPQASSAVESVVLRQGSFTVIDNIHKGSGIAKIIQTGSKYYIVLEDFKVTNGPDLYIYLSKNSNIKNGDALGEYKEIAPLKGNEGNQVYEITKEDAENFSSVVIWCKRFSVLFSSATLVSAELSVVTTKRDI